MCESSCMEVADYWLLSDWPSPWLDCELFFPVGTGGGGYVT